MVITARDRRLQVETWGEKREGRDRGSINAGHSTPIQSSNDEQTTRITGGVGLFRLGLHLAFVTELIQIHFPASAFLNWGGGNCFSSPLWNM